MKVKNLAKQFNINVPIKPNPNLFRLLRNEKSKIEPIETAGIYQLNLTDSNGTP